MGVPEHNEVPSIAFMPHAEEYRVDFPHSFRHIRKQHHELLPDPTDLAILDNRKTQARAMSLECKAPRFVVDHEAATNHPSENCKRLKV